MSTRAARFCAACGASLEGKPRISARSIVIIGFSAVALWVVGWKTQEHLTGVKPTSDSNDVVDSAPAEDVYTDSALRKLKDSADANPKDVIGWRVLADALGKKTGPRDNPNQSVVFELVDVLGKILDIDPSDEQALISLANLSFNQMAFEKAVQFYERYLSRRPDDHDARVSYASSFTFLGMNDRALGELEKILEKAPKHFQASAMKMVVLAQMGKIVEADAQAARAVTLAPNNEGREKINEFMKSIHEKASQGTATAAPVGKGFDGVVAAIKANPIAGPKVSRSEKDGDRGGSVYFKDFPMDQMPPFARDKFLGGIASQMKESGLPDGAVIHLRDEATGKEMATVP